MGLFRRLGVSAGAAAALAAVLAAGAGTMAAQTHDWAINPAASEADFSVQSTGGGAVHGSLHGINGVIRFDAGNPNVWTVNATVDMNSVSTGVAAEDQDLKGIFNAAQYPTLTFKSRKVRQDYSSSGYRVTGALTMHGVTKRVVLILDAPGDARLGMDATHMNRVFHATVTVHPKDFGLNGTLANGQNLANETVKIKLTIETKEK